MRNVSLPRHLVPMILLLTLAPFGGCGQEQPAPAANAGTNATAQLPDSDPPVLTKAVVDKLQKGMPQKEALTILRDAGREARSSTTLLDNIYDQGMLNTLRYDLTIVHGKKKLVLAFRSGKLEEKTVEGMD